MLNSCYLIGSLRNKEIPKIANTIRQAVPSLEVFDDWHSAGPIADDSWQEYENGRNHSYDEALEGYAAKHVFSFDKYHLDRVSGGILVLPAGKSGHLELGYLAGQGKTCYILMDKEPERYDVMYQFATGGVYFSLEKLIENLSSGTHVGNQGVQLPRLLRRSDDIARKQPRSLQSGREGCGETWRQGVEGEPHGINPSSIGGDRFLVKGGAGIGYSVDLSGSRSSGSITGLAAKQGSPCREGSS